MKVRQRNKERDGEKEMIRQQKLHEERELQARNAAIKKNQKQAIEQNKMSQAMRNAHEAERLKRERQQHNEMIEMQKKSDELKAQTMKHMIRGQKEE